MIKIVYILYIVIANKRLSFMRNKMRISNEKKFFESGYFSEFSQESAVIGYFKCALNNIKNIFQL